jgi:hypothetical protein
LSRGREAEREKRGSGEEREKREREGGGQRGIVLHKLSLSLFRARALSGSLSLTLSQQTGRIAEGNDARTVHNRSISIVLDLPHLAMRLTQKTACRANMFMPG